MIILAIDQASKTAYSVLSVEEGIPNVGDFGTIDYSSIKDADVRINKLKHKVSELVNTYKPDIVYIEDIQLEHGNVKVYKFLAKLQGAFIDYFIDNNIKYDVIVPSSWKSFLGVNIKNKRPQQKAETIEIIEHMFGVKVNEDEADSIGISYYFLKGNKTK